MFSSGYVSSQQRRASLKRKYEAYNPRSRLSQSRDLDTEPADKVAFTQSSSSSTTPPTTSTSSPSLDPLVHQQKYNSFPDFASIQFQPHQATNQQLTPPQASASFFGTSAPAFQTYSFQTSTTITSQGTSTQPVQNPTLSSSSDKLNHVKAYTFNPPPTTLGFTLPPPTSPSLTATTPSTSTSTSTPTSTSTSTSIAASTSTSTAISTVTHPAFSGSGSAFNVSGSVFSSPTTTKTTTTTASTTTPTTSPVISPFISPPTSPTAASTPSPDFYNVQMEPGFISLKTSINMELPPPPQNSQLLNHVKFATPQRAESEWVRTKDKCTIVLIGPCNLGKKFLINTILSTTYETKRVRPTLGRHRSTGVAMGAQRQSLSINSPVSPVAPVPTTPVSRNVSISVTHNNEKSDFDFELIPNSEPANNAGPSGENARSKSIDEEHPLDTAFLNGMNWEREKQAEMQEIYSTSQYCITKNNAIRDDRAFVVPQGSKKFTSTSQLFTVSYDRTPQVLFTFLMESDLRIMLWQLHEHYEQGGKRSTLSHARLEFLHHIYRMVIDTNPPLTGNTILSYLASSSELPIRAPVRVLLGKVHRYIGAGQDPVVDRVFVREKIKEVCFKYQYLIKSIEVKVPARVLHRGRKEIVILSDTTAHGHIRSSHIIQCINTADMVLLAVDNNGLTNELASLLVSSRFLSKVTKDPSSVIALDLTEGRPRSHQRLGNSIKDHLIAQFRRLYRDIDSASLRNSLPKILAEMDVLTLKPLLFSSLELNSTVPPGYQDKMTLESLKSSTNMPLLLSRIAALIPNTSANRFSGKGPIPIAITPVTPAVPMDTRPPISTEQLVSSFKQRLQVSDGSTPPSSTPSSLTNSAPAVAHPPPTLSSTPTPTHASNPLLRSKFEYWQACMLSLITSPECNYEYARRADECCKRAVNDWESHFRDQFMSNADTCSIILDPKYKGECLGVNINFLFFADIASWTPYFWRDSVLARVNALQSEMLEFARRMLEAEAKKIEAKYSASGDSAVRMQQHTLLQYCHAAMEKSITTKFASLFDALKIDVSSIISSICSELLVARLLNKSQTVHGIKQYHKIIVDALHYLPFDAAGAIKARFTEIIKAATQYLDPIELHMDQLLLSLSSSQNQFKNMDPTMRQHMQQRMFANMRFGKRTGGVGARPIASTISTSSPSNWTRDDVMSDAPNTTATTTTTTSSIATPFTINENNNRSYPNSPSTPTITSSPSLNNRFIDNSNFQNTFNNTLSNNTFHNNTISNKVNFSAVVVPTVRSSLPVPPHSPPSLVTLSIQTICKHITKIHALQSGLLPEEVIQRIIACLISDEMSVYIRQLDSSILGKLLDNSLYSLDFENATSLYPSSCMVLASRCSNLRRLNLKHCIIESINLEGCYQVGDTGVVALARGCPSLCHINLSGCIRITGILTRIKSEISDNECTEITDEAFQCVSAEHGSQLLQVDLSECRNITDRTLTKLGQFCSNLSILNLCGKGITDDGLRSVVDGCPNLMELEMVSCDTLTNGGIQQCARLTSLRVLTLSTMRALTDQAFESNSMSDITDAPTQQWPNLQALTLSKCPLLSNKSISFFAKNCSLLTSVDFGFFTQISDAAVQEIAQACPLQDVDLSSCKEITDAAVMQVARKCSLRKLVVASCGNITDASLIAVAQNPGLQHLDLTLCERITDEGVVKVAQGCPDLKFISLSECNITDNSILALGAAVDGQGSGCYNLETVRLVFCREVGNEALHKLARGCPHIHTLDLSNCSARITPEGLRIALRTLARLQTLRLKGFHLSSESIIDGVHPSLKVLNLSWCRNIEDKVLVDIATACPALEQCDITRCTKITNDAVTKLTGKCSNLRQLNLTGCKDVTQGLVQMLVKIGKMIQR